MTRREVLSTVLGAAMVCIVVASCAALLPVAAGTNSQVIIGESFASGAEAAQELQLAINRVETVGCEAKSIGGYGAGGEGLIIGLAALVTCPDGVDLIPTGFPYDSLGNAIPIDTTGLTPPTIP